MRKVDVITAGDFCENCQLMQLDEYEFVAIDGRKYTKSYKCMNTEYCENAIKLFAEYKGIKNDVQEDDWMEDQAL